MIKVAGRTLLVAGMTIATFIPAAAEAQEGQVAVMPMIHTELPVDDGLAFAGQIAARIRAENPSIRVVGPLEAAAVLDSLDLQTYWDRLLFIFLRTGIVDRTGLSGLCDELQVDGIVHVEMAALIEQGPWTLQRRYVLRGLRTILRAWYLDCTLGTVGWERSGAGRVEDMQDALKPGFSLDRIPAAAPAALALDDLLGRLPRITPQRAP